MPLGDPPHMPAAALMSFEKAPESSALKKPVNVLRVGHRRPPLSDPPGAPAAGLVRSRGPLSTSMSSWTLVHPWTSPLHAGLKFTTHEIYCTKGETSARRNLAPRFFLHLGYSWQILPHVKLPASAVHGAEPLSYIIADEAQRMRK